MAEVPLSGRLDEVSFAEVTGALFREKKPLPDQRIQVQLKGNPVLCFQDLHAGKHQ